MSTLPTIATVPRPESLGYGARLNDRLVRLAAGPGRALSVEMAELAPPRFQTEAHPEEILSAFGDVYSMADPTGGEGLFDRFRRRGSDGDATRFWLSKGVDVSPPDEGEPKGVQLLTTTTLIDALTADPVRIAVAGTTLWVTNGQQVRKTTDITAVTPAFTDESPHAGDPVGPVHDLAALSSTPYAALGANGIHRDPGTGWAAWSDLATVRIWEALDRIIASTGTALYEADAGATSTLLYTLPAGASWVDVKPANGAIIAAASNGYVYVFTLNDTQDLVPATSIEMAGEIPTALASRAELVWIATRDGDKARLWESPLSEGGTFGSLQLIREWTGAVTTLRATRDRVLIGVKETGQDAHVWRLELETSGLSQAQALGAGEVNGLAVVAGKVIAGVAGQGLYREGTVVSESGYLISPRVDFFRDEDKSWVTGWAHVEVPDGARAELYFSTDPDAMNDPDHVGWKRLKTYFATSEGVEVGLGDVVSRAIAGMVRLYRAADGASPKVHSFSFRSYPTGSDVILRIPVDVGDQLERAGRRRTPVPGWGQLVYAALRDMEGQAVECEVFRTGDLVRGLVQNVATQLPGLTALGTATVVSIVTVRGRRVAR